VIINIGGQLTTITENCTLYCSSEQLYVCLDWAITIIPSRTSWGYLEIWHYISVLPL